MSDETKTPRYDTVSFDPEIGKLFDKMCEVSHRKKKDMFEWLVLTMYSQIVDEKPAE